MNIPLASGLAGDIKFQPVETTQPQVFVRAFSVPAAMPWEQTRAAQLEVRHGAPLPLAEVIFRLRRLGSWGLGRPGRFAVFYIRSREFKGAFETTVEVDGEPVRVAFGSTGKQLRRAQSSLPIVLLVSTTVFLLTAAPMFALSSKKQANQRLDSIERSIVSKGKMADAAKRQRDNDRALRSAVGSSAPVNAVLHELSWATAAKNPEANIVAFHWDRGFLAVETRGEASPFDGADRRLEKADKPVKNDIWLWGVSREGDTAGRPGLP